ncbi:uncharacterized protein LOC123298199 isoform X2 [Chrysoperla carnea]|uniref:uncharacterized protein LOC123298199 isoform X2 n=1 Tax=Chrysoperla carnea TaxID=189513 RepID=UPI001D089873|nr:uncharacterized protein LOC123298199 isoform X2 [Chrysoperla carnea]
MKYPQLVSMPSVVSDWLEEQLEARGIDAVVYTRYVLSLLHRDPQDLTSSDLDLFGIEQTKQCGIESLVDELCIKLRQIENKTDDELETSQKTEITKVANENNKISPNDLARRYYAAFPALNGKTNNDERLTIIPNKGGLSWNHLAKKLTGSGDNDKKKNHPDNKIKTNCISWNTMPSKSIDNKCFAYFNHSKKEPVTKLGLNCSTRIMAKSAERCEGNSISFWDEQVHWHNQQNRFNNADEGYSTSDTTGLFDDELQPSVPRCDSIDNNQNIDDLDKLVAKFDRSIEALWSPETNNENEDLPSQEDDFQDVPVDLQELLASPSDIKSPNSDILTMFKKDSSFVIQKPRTFLQCGTNIISSIWSQQENIDKSHLLEQTFNNHPHKNDQVKTEEIVVNSFWNDENINILEQNKANTFIENLTFLNSNNHLFNNNNDGADYSQKLFTFGWEYGYPEINQNKWSSEAGGDMLKTTPTFDSKKNDIDIKELNISFTKLNHNKENSVFTEVKPKETKSTRANDSNSALLRPHTNHATDTDTVEDDLLTSRRTHFCPIRLDCGNKSYPSTNLLPDGSTFDIHGSPDKVLFRRTDSGTMFLESDYESPKEYMEFKGTCSSLTSLDSESSDDELGFVTNDASNFVLKFRVRQNEKYCQTDENESPSESPHDVVPAKRRICDTNELFFPGDEELADEIDCTCLENQSLFTKCKTHTLSECEQCGDSGWPTDLPGQFVVPSGLWNNERIWSSREKLCSSCGFLNNDNKAPAPPRGLRDEVRQEGEQLLSDISSIQRLCWFDLGTNFITEERSASSREERKRRHSASLRPHTLAWHPIPSHLKALRSLTF